MGGRFAPEEQPIHPARRAAVVAPTFLAPEMLHVYRQVAGLRRHRATVFTHKRTHPDRFPFEPVVVLPRPLLGELRRFWARRMARSPVVAFRSEARRLDQHLAAAAAQVVHFYFGQNGLYWLPWLERRRLPAVVSFHGADGAVGMTRPAARRLLTRLFRAVDLVLVRSDELGSAVRALGCPDAVIRLQRTGIPLDAFPFLEREPQAGADASPLLVQACRLIAKKGVDDTLRAFARLRTGMPGARLAIAGGGALEPTLRAMARDLGVADAVEWHGFLSQESLRNLFDRAHVFVHPSKLTPEGDREGVPNSMLEAMATGLPVVATRHGGIPEAVRDGRDGILVPEDDPAALADAIASLLADPQRHRALARGASQHAAAAFSLDAQCAALEDRYDEAVRLFHDRGHG